MKRYRLLKDCPSYMFSLLSGLPSTISAGTIAEPYTSSAYFVGGFVMPKGFVENNPDWFEEVKEEPKGVFDGIERYQETSGQLAERICGGMTASEALKQNSVGFKPQGDQVRRKARAYRWPLGRKDEWGVTNTLWSEHEAKFQRRCSASDDTHAYEWPALPDKDGYYPGPK